MQNYLHCLFNSFAKLISIVISVIVYLVRIAQIFACANRQQNMINLGAELKKKTLFTGDVPFTSRSHTSDCSAVLQSAV